MRGLIIGRYQPFHLGHIKVITEIMNEIEELIIGVGSAQYSHTLQDPFTAGERILMIKKALDESKIPRNRYYIIPIPDVNQHALWVARTESLTPPFEIVYSHNPLVKRLFKEANYKIKEPPLFSRQLYSGTEIRRRIISGENWVELVPSAVTAVINEIDGVNRLKQLAQKEL